ncbi:MAG TPA: hypothetical protein VLE99_05805 [Candidatus Saccharimonadales bacterium]|nr:hypothetical protein [Candidatus Saccharimonadales bacterium]
MHLWPASYVFNLPHRIFAGTVLYIVATVLLYRRHFRHHPEATSKQRRHWFWLALTPLLIGTAILLTAFALSFQNWQF